MLDDLYLRELVASGERLPAFMADDGGPEEPDPEGDDQGEGELS